MVTLEVVIVKQRREGPRAGIWQRSWCYMHQVEIGSGCQVSRWKAVAVTVCHNRDQADQGGMLLQEARLENESVDYALTGLASTRPQCCKPCYENEKRELLAVCSSNTLYHLRQWGYVFSLLRLEF
jgi:hypothetical protein